LLVALPLPGSQHQPACAFADGSQLRSCPEEHRTPQLGDGLASTLDDVEGVVNQSCMGQRRVVTDGFFERLVRVGREQLDRSLSLGAERVEPALERLAVAAVAEPNGYARRQVADERDELLLALVASPKPLLIDANLRQRHLRRRAFPALDWTKLGAPDRLPAQPPFR
jgi:hypothetical protein